MRFLKKKAFSDAVRIFDSLYTSSNTGWRSASSTSFFELHRRPPLFEVDCAPHDWQIVYYYLL